MSNKLRVLISSVGSLVGQNIIDALEWSECPRRNYVEIIGTNSDTQSANNYRCDRCYFVPETQHKDFYNSILSILQKESIDLILNGRDEDTEFFTRLLSDHAIINSKTPYGSQHSLVIALDKWQTSQFCDKYHLPFARTFNPRLSNNIDSELLLFCEQVGFPIIAKPTRGFASKGVYFAQNIDEAKHASSFKGYILQEYLGDGSKLFDYFQSSSKLIPLFAHAPEIFHYSCHTYISPRGDITPIFCSHNAHNSGITMGFQFQKNEALIAHTIKYAESIYKEGGFGPLTVQFKQDKYGDWKAQEMNMRTNGNTFPRLILGQDDIGLIINTHFPELGFPLLQRGSYSQDYIAKQLTCFQIKDKDRKEFLGQKMWEKISSND